MKLLIEKRHRSAYGGPKKPAITKKEPYGRMIRQSFKDDEHGGRVINRHASRRTPVRNARVYLGRAA